MIVENLKEADFGEVIALIKEFAQFQNHPELMTNSVEKMKDEKEHFKGFVVRDDNKRIVGYTIFFVAYYTWSGKTVYMDDLYVCQSQRGGGLGSKLIHAVIDYAKQNNFGQVRWQVSNWNNPAIKFYESLGASISEIENNCILKVKI